MKPGHFIIYIVVALLGFSIVTVYSTDKATFISSGNGYQIMKHLLWVLIGFTVLMAMSYVDYHYLRKFSIPLFAISVLLLVLVLIPGIGAYINGARRWIRFSSILGFQPSEFAKLSMIIFLARYIERNHQVMTDFKRGFIVPLLIASGISGLVILEPDFGTASFIIVISMIMLIAGGTKIIYACFTTLAAIPFVHQLVLDSPYRKARLTAFLDPWKDPSGTGYHVIQSWIALGSGGFSGVGLGNSKQKLFFLPESNSDFIFTIIGEEVGFLGVIAIISLFSLLLWQGLKVVNATKDVFGFFLGFGITLMFGLQAIVNIAVVSGILPTKGIPLPLVSTGGSSLLFSMIGIGILVNVAKQTGAQSIKAPFLYEEATSNNAVKGFWPIRMCQKVFQKVGGFSW